MILKFNAVVGDFAQVRQRKNLVTAAIGQDRSVPIHEIVQAAEVFNHIQARPNEQVICVAENDLSIHLAQFAWSHSFHGALRPDWHKRRRIDHAMRCCQPTASGFRMSIGGQKFEVFLHPN